MNENNIILLTDSYKVSHWKQYPPKTEIVYSYFESRFENKKVLFFGLQYFLKKYLCGQVVTKEKIDEAEKAFKLHFGSDLFNRAGWEYILEKHNGYLPIRINAIPEGTVTYSLTPLITVENTDPNCYWLTNYIETLLVQVWYPTTIATNSYNMKKMLLKYLEKTGTPESIDFKLHDFGFRGVSSVETAGLGGCSHLLNFKGTDTFQGIVFARNYYGSEMAGFSIPASEHSTITSWGKDNELKAMENMLDQYPDGLVACVSDSFDIYRACSEYWGTDLKDKVLGRNGTLVIRPDSGHPPEVVCSVLEFLGSKFGSTVNEKSYKVLPPQVRIIQGDGIDLEMLDNTLRLMTDNGWSTDNIAFGSGGGLLQKFNRDTLKFAFKCSAIKIDGEWRDVYKDPITDKGKMSKRGRFNDSQLETVFENGTLLISHDLDECRGRANDPIK